MRSLTFGLLLVFSLGEPHSRVTITELPPEQVPAGTCVAGNAGFLGVVERDDHERTDLTNAEIGGWVKNKLKEGYSVMLYPQKSGRIYSITKCEATQH